MATVFSGGTYVNTTFTGALRSDLLSNLKTQLVIAGWTNVAYATGQGLGNVGVVTVTIATPGVFTFNSHGFLANDRVILQTTGALPTGFSVNTVYFVRNPATNTFELSASSGGSSIATSGSQSGVHTINSESVLLQSATPPNVTNPIRVRLKDNRSTCIQFAIENQAGTLIGTISGGNGSGNLLPAAAKVFRVIATRYHFLVFKDAGASLAREFVMAGMLSIPSFVTSVTDEGYLLSQSFSDSDTSTIPSLRNGMTLGGQNNCGNMQVIWNANIWDFGLLNVPSGGTPQVIFTWFYRITGDGPIGNYRWDNGDLFSSDVLLTSGLTGRNDEAKIKGQFFDMVYITSPFTVDVEDTFNSHTWHNICNNNSGSASTPSGGIWVAVS